MIYDNIEFHNVAEFSEQANVPGQFLERYPVSVQDCMFGKVVAQNTASCELRFVTDSRQIRLTLSSAIDTTIIHVFCGDFFHSSHTLEAGVIKTVQFGPHEKFSKEHRDEIKDWKRFSPKVWRVVFGKNRIRYHGIEVYGDLRPPAKDELPAKRYLAYGSSITQGYSAIDNNNCYVSVAARELGMDCLNMGMSGHCMIEPEAADYFAARDDWDLMTAELGINVLGAYEIEEFSQKSDYFIRKIAESRPDKPIAIITIYPHYHTAAKYTSEDEIRKHRKNEAEFNSSLREIVSKYAFGNVSLIEGSQILSSPEYLTVDMVHPSDYGMIEMGKNLAFQLKNLL